MASRVKIRALLSKYEDSIRSIVKLEEGGLETLDDIFEYNNFLYNVYDIKKEVEQNVNSDLDWVEYSSANKWMQRVGYYSGVRERDND